MNQQENRNDMPRIDMQLRVRYNTPESSGEGIATDISPRGLRLVSDAELQEGQSCDIIIDSGDAEDGELSNQAQVTWCRSRLSPSGQSKYDIGLHLNGTWFQNKRGRLANALAHIFALNKVEPARQYERTKVSFEAENKNNPTEILHIADLSVGGMKIEAPQAFSTKPERGQQVVVLFVVDDNSYSLDGHIAWTKQKDPMIPDSVDALGICFTDAGRTETELLEMMARGECEPTHLQIDYTV